MRIHKSIFVLLIIVAMAAGAAAQEFELPDAALADATSFYHFAQRVFKQDQPSHDPRVQAPV